MPRGPSWKKTGFQIPAFHESKWEKGGLQTSLCLESPLESCVSGLGCPVYMKRPRNVDKTDTLKGMMEATKAMNSEKGQESCGQLLRPGTRPHARLSLQSHFNTYHTRWMILPSIGVRTLHEIVSSVCG